MVTGINAFLSSANEIGEGFLDYWRSMQEMIVSDHSLVTVMKEGKSVGQVSLSDMVAAIAKPKTTQTGEANAYR